MGFKGEPLQLCAAARTAAGAAAGAGSEQSTGATFSLTTSKQLLYIIQAGARPAAAPAAGGLTEPGPAAPPSCGPAVEELTFMEAYGAISQQVWADRYLLVGFRSGQVVVLAPDR